MKTCAGWPAIALLVGSPLAWADDGANPIPSPAKPGRYTITINLGGFDRVAHVHVPAGYKPGCPAAAGVDVARCGRHRNRYPGQGRLGRQGRQRRLCRSRARRTAGTAARAGAVPHQSVAVEFGTTAGRLAARGHRRRGVCAAIVGRATDQTALRSSAGYFVPATAMAVA